MSNLLSSLAYIKARVDMGLTVWDSLVDLMLNIIHQVDIIEISSESFCSAFLDVYDIKIPLHPMNTIIGKIKQKGLIEIVNGNWILKRN